MHCPTHALVGAAVLLAAAPVSAQTAPDGGALDGSDEAALDVSDEAALDVSDEAAALYEAGTRAFDDGRYEDALRLATEAQQRDPNVFFLYAIGRANLKLGRFAAAKEFFVRVELAPGVKPALAKRAREHIEEMEARGQLDRPGAAGQAEADRAAVVLAAQASTEPLYPWLTVGAGAFLLAAGAALWISADSARDTIHSYPRREDGALLVGPEEALALQASANDKATLAVALGSVGVALVSAGLWWRRAARRAERPGGAASRSELSMAMTPTGMVVIRGGF